jgi:HD-GYP domain-containing protein (c-di-GMP phosphodiesterase class II)
MRAIPTQYVQENTILGEDLYTSKGIILVRSGSKLTKKLIKKINENQIFTVYIKDEHSNNEVDRLLEQSLRVKGTMLIKELFDKVIKKEEILTIHNKISDYADDVLYELNSVRNKQIEYIDIKNVGMYLYSSSLNVAIISALLAWDLGYNNNMVKQIFLGGIYHDLGLAMLPENVINKSSELTLEEKKMILMHPVSGHKFIKDKGFLTAYIKVIALQHHERLNGTGYPKRVSKEAINPLAQIIGLVDIYDAMTSDRPYKRSVSSKEAIEYIMGSAGSHFDHKITLAFIKKINPYPRGSLIELSDGRFAVVDEVYKNLPLSPLVRIIKKDKEKYIYESLDLKNQPNLVVKQIVYEIK